MHIASIIYNCIMAIIAGLNLLGALTQRSLDKALLGACCVFALYVIGQALHNTAVSLQAMDDDGEKAAARRGRR